LTFVRKKSPFSSYFQLSNFFCLHTTTHFSHDWLLGSVFSSCIHTFCNHFVSNYAELFLDTFSLLFSLNLMVTSHRGPFLTTRTSMTGLRAVRSSTNFLWQLLCLFSIEGCDLIFFHTL
jgi:hypothetical protein